MGHIHRSHGCLYLHVPIHTQSQKYLRFHFKGVTYQFTSLPFGLATAALIFTSIVKEVKLMALQSGIRLHQYLDNWLIRAPSEQECKEQTQKLLKLVKELSFIVNLKKSEFRPSQRLDFRGYQFLLDFALVQPTQDKWTKLQEMFHCLSTKSVIRARTLMSTTGLLASTEKIVKLGRMHMEPFQDMLPSHNPGLKQIMSSGDPLDCVLDLVSPKQCYTRSKTCTRLTQCDSGRPLKVEPDPKNRVVPSSTDLQTNFQTRPSGLGSGCPQHSMGQPDCICVPSHCPAAQGCTKASISNVQDNSDCPRLADKTVVLGPSGDVSGHSKTTATNTHSAQTTTEQPLPRHPNIPESPCLVSRSSALQEHGFTAEVAERISAPQRLPTRSIYTSKWTVFQL